MAVKFSEGIVKFTIGGLVCQSSICLLMKNSLQYSNGWNGEVCRTKKHPLFRNNFKYQIFKMNKLHDLPLLMQNCNHVDSKSWQNQGGHHY